uniref:Uncharacterized protein n=1 Tax=Romanomermis culicivorax TaxID=13658 RepID=A0A915HTD2_ROMCU
MVVGRLVRTNGTAPNDSILATTVLVESEGWSINWAKPRGLGLPEYFAINFDANSGASSINSVTQLRNFSFRAFSFDHKINAQAPAVDNNATVKARPRRTVL